jgi:hypothetical protein
MEQVEERCTEQPCASLQQSAPHQHIRQVRLCLFLAGMDHGEKCNTWWSVISGAAPATEAR